MNARIHIGLEWVWGRRRSHQHQRWIQLWIVPHNMLVTDRLCLLHGFMANEATRSFFTRGMNGTIILWRKERWVEWMKDCKKLLEMLAVLCHLLGGQPARGSELVTLRWRNSVDEKRGVYWANGTVILITMYSKMRSIIWHNKLIPR